MEGLASATVAIQLHDREKRRLREGLHLMQYNSVYRRTTSYSSYKKKDDVDFLFWHLSYL
jgi:hypothetical protein